MATGSDTNFDAQYQTEPIAFDATELNVCAKCGRANAPNRPTCIYCGADLAVREEFLSRIQLPNSDLDPDALGYNVVVQAGELSLDQVEFAAIAEQLSGLRAIVPLARYESERDAELAVKRFASEKFVPRVVSDRDLVTRSPTRLAGAEFGNASIVLKLFNTGEKISFATDDVAVIVSGIISRSRADIVEKRGRKGKVKQLDETLTASDEALLDIYIRSETKSFRVNLTGFDFSCLGEAKSMFAAENMTRLNERLREIAPAAKFINEYKMLREHLDSVWPLEIRTDPRGLVRSGFGKTDFGKVSTTDNTLQMNKFSALQAIAR